MACSPDERNERLNEDSEIYKEYMNMLIAEVDGSDTFIEDHVESKYYRLLNSKSIVGQEDSLVSGINFLKVDGKEKRQEDCLKEGNQICKQKV